MSNLVVNGDFSQSVSLGYAIPTGWTGTSSSYFLTDKHPFQVFGDVKNLPDIYTYFTCFFLNNTFGPIDLSQNIVFPRTGYYTLTFWSGVPKHRFFANNFFSPAQVTTVSVGGKSLLTYSFQTEDDPHIKYTVPFYVNASSAELKFSSSKTALAGYAGGPVMYLYGCSIVYSGSENRVLSSVNPYNIKHYFTNSLRDGYQDLGSLFENNDNVTVSYNATIPSKRVKTVAFPSSTLMVKDGDVVANRYGAGSVQTESMTFGPSTTAVTVAGGSGGNTLAYSLNGRSWVGLGNKVFSGVCNDVKWNGTVWVATGYGGNSLAYSYDGFTWTGSGSPLDYGTSVSWNGSVWVAGGFVQLFADYPMNLVSYYSFDVGSVSGSNIVNYVTNLFDASLNGNTVGVGIPTINSSNYKVGTGSLSFDVSGQFVAINSGLTSDLNGLTFAFWMRGNNSIGNYTVFDFAGGAGGNNKITWGLQSNTIYTQVVSDVSVGTLSFTPVTTAATLITQQYTGLAISGNGQTIAYCNVNNGNIQYQTGGFGSILNTLSTNYTGVTGICMTRDASRIIWVVRGGGIYMALWNGVNYGTTYTTVTSTIRSYNGIDITDDGNRFITVAGFGGTADVPYWFNWNGSNNYVLGGSIAATASALLNAAITADGNRVAFSNLSVIYYSFWNGSAYVYNASNSITSTIGAGLKFSKDGNILFSAGSSGVLQYSLFNGSVYGAAINTSIVFGDWLFYIDYNNNLYGSVYTAVAAIGNLNKTTFTPQYSYFKSNFPAITSGFPNLNDNVWRHFAWTIDPANKTYKHYINGSLIATDASTGYVFPQIGFNRTQNRLGVSNDLSMSYFVGGLDDFRIYKRVLSSAEVASLIYSPVVLSPSVSIPTSYYYPFDAGSTSGTNLGNFNTGTFVYDASLNGNTVGVGRPTINTSNYAVGTGSLAFDVAGQFVAINSIMTSDLNGLSFAFWMRGNNSVGNYTVLDFAGGAGGNNKITYGLQNNTIYTQVTNSGNVGTLSFTPSTNPLGDVTSITAGYWDGIAVTDDGQKMFVYNYFSGTLYYSTYNKTTSTWVSPPTSINTFTASTLISCCIKSDGSRIFLAGYANPQWGTWNGASFTMTTITNSKSYQGLDMTPDGNRVILSADFVYFTTWNGTGYNSLTSTGISVSASCLGIGVSRDGHKLAFADGTSLKTAFWNGSTYVLNSSINITLPTLTVVSGKTSATYGTCRFSPDGNILFLIAAYATNFSLIYYRWNGSSYDISGSLPTNYFYTAGSSCWGMCITMDNSIYLNSFIKDTTIPVFKTTFSASNLYSNTNFPAITSTYPTLNDNVWRHFAWTIDPVNYTYKHYINGTLLATDVSTGYVFPQIGFNRTQNRLAIANDLSMSYFVGGLDDFRVYKKVLTATEINSIVYTPVVAPTSYYYSFDAGSASGNNLGNYATGAYVYDAILSGNSVAVGTPTINSTNYKVGTGSLAFDVSGQFVAINSGMTTDANGLSFAFWMRGNNSVGNYTVMDFAGGAGGNNKITWGLQSNTIYTQVTSNGNVGAVSLTTPANVIDISGTGTHGICMTGDGKRILIPSYEDGTIKTYTYSGSTWSLSNTLSSIINLTGVCCTADGNRIVFTRRENGVYFATWNSGTSTYTVQPAISTSFLKTAFPSMTPDGRVLLFSTSFSVVSLPVKYSFWTGSAYTTPVDVSGCINGSYSGTDITQDGSRIAYANYTTGVVYSGYWNGSIYVQDTASVGTIANATQVRFSPDGNILFVLISTATTYYSVFNGTTYGPLTTSGVSFTFTGTNTAGVIVGYDNSVYACGYTAPGTNAYIQRATFTASNSYLKTNFPAIQSSFPTLNDNVWRHFVWTIDPVNYTYKHYINGALVITDVSTAYVFPQIGFNRTKNLLGIANDLSMSYFVGGLDDFRVYKRVLTATEVINLFPKYVYTPSTTFTTKMYYPFDTGSTSGTNLGNYSTGIYVYDASLSGNSVAVGTPTINSTNYKVGTGSLAFDVSGQFVAINSGLSSDANGLSFAFWMRGNNSIGNYTVFDFAGGAGGNNGIKYGLLNNTIYSQVVSDSSMGSLSITTPVNIGISGTIIRGICLSYDAKKLIISYNSSQVSTYIYTNSTWTLINSFTPSGIIYGISCTANGNRIIFTTITNGAYYADWNTNTSSYSTPISISTPYYPFSVSSTPDGNILLFGFTSGPIPVYYSIWNGSSYSSPTAVTGCTTGSYAYRNTTITHDGSRIAYYYQVTTSGVVFTGFWNGTTYVQNATTYSFASPNGPSSICFSADGNILFVFRNGSILSYSIFNGTTYIAFQNITFTGASWSCSIGNSIYSSFNSPNIAVSTFSASNLYSNTNFPAILSAYPTLNDNQWRHFAWTIDPVNKTYKHYINGTLLVTDVSTGYVFPQIGFNRTQNRLGIANDLSMSYFTGGLDDFRVYSSVLTAHEVEYLYKGKSRLYSYDGKTWSKAMIQYETNSITNSIANNGAVYISAGKGLNTLNYSYDGLQWAGLGNTTFVTEAMGIAWNGSLFVAVGSGGNTLAYSNDGFLWKGLQNSVFTISGISVASNGLMWLASGTGTYTMAYSNDGLNWTGYNHPILAVVNQISWTGKYWTTVGVGSTVNTVAYSFDGLTWTGQNLGSVNTTTNVLSSNQVRPHKITFPNKLIVAVGRGNGNTIATSVDGLTWTGRGKSVFTTYGEQVAWNGRMWVGVGAGGNTLAYSFNGTAWTGLGSNVFTTRGSSVAWCGNKWLAGGFGGNTLAYSYDGMTWTGMGVVVTNGLECLGIAWNGSIHMIVGNNGNVVFAKWSSDGFQYTDISATGLSVSGTQFVRYDNRNFVLSGGNLYDPEIDRLSAFSSPVMTVSGWDYAWNGSKQILVGRNADGTGQIFGLGTGIGTGQGTSQGTGTGNNWTTIIETVTNTSDTAYAVSWIGDKWIVGSSATGGNSLSYSIDGSTWIGLGKTVLDVSCMGVAWNGNVPNVFIQHPTIVVGGGTGGNTLAYSDDGIQWKGLGKTVFDASGTEVAWNGSVWISTGSGTGNTLAYSTDGLSWTGLGKTLFTSSGSDVAWNGSIWVAVGTGKNNIIYSPNGLNWLSAVSAGAFDTINCLVWNGILWIVGGSIYTNNTNEYLALYYPMDTGSTSGTNLGNYAKGTYVYDAVLSGNSVSVGTPTINTSQYAVGTGSLSFDISGQYVAINAGLATDANGLSFAFWMRGNNLVGNNTVFDFSLGAGGNTIKYGLQNNTVYTHVTSSTSVGKMTFTTPANVLDINFTGSYGFAMSSNRDVLLITNYDAGAIYRYGVVNNVTTLQYTLDLTDISNVTGVCCTADANRIVFTRQTNSVGVYFATWDSGSSSYSTPTSFSSLTNTASPSMTPDGRVLVFSAGFGASEKVYYSFWNGSTYSNPTAITSCINGNYMGTDISHDGSKVAYVSYATGAVFYATWNGSVYTQAATISTIVGGRQVRFSPDGYILFLLTGATATSNLYFSVFSISLNSFGLIYSANQLFTNITTDNASGIVVGSDSSIYVSNYTTGAVYAYVQRLTYNASYLYYQTNMSAIQTAYPNLNDNNWRHFIWTIDPLTYTYKHYINGVLVVTDTSSAYPFPAFGCIRTPNYLGVGKNVSNQALTTSFFLGGLDDFRVYKKVLTPLEIASLLQAQTLYPLPSKHYPFDTGSASGTNLGNFNTGTYVYDASLNGNSVAVGTPTINTSIYKVGTGSLAFDVSGQFVAINSGLTSDANGLSFAFWMRGNNSIGNYTVLDFAGGAGGNNKITWGLKNNTVYTQVVSDVSVGSLSFTPYTKVFPTDLTVGIDTAYTSICVTKNGTRIVWDKYNDPVKILFKDYSNGSWGATNIFTIPAVTPGYGLTDICVSADGELLTYGYAFNLTCYQASWNNSISNYSNPVVIDSTNRSTRSLKMTPDGSTLALVCDDPGNGQKVFFSKRNANGLFGNFINVTGITGTHCFAVAITDDASKIIYWDYASNVTANQKIFICNWNGSTFIESGSINTSNLGYIISLCFSNDGNIIFASISQNTSYILAYSVYDTNTSSYGSFTMVNPGNNPVTTSTYIYGLFFGVDLSGNDKALYQLAGIDSKNVWKTVVSASNLYSNTNFPAIQSTYPTLNDNVWRHFVWTIDPANKTYKHYINGSLLVTDVSTAYVFPQIGFNRTQNRLAIANDLSMSYFVGGLDDFRVYNRVLSINEIGSIYNYKGSIVNIGSVVYPSEYNKRMVSYDGKTWTKSNSNGLDTSIANHMAWNGTLWVAVGKGDDSITYSYDGITWKGQGKTTFTSVANGVAWNGRLFVAMGSGGNTIAYSGDGLVWTGLGTGVFSTSGVSVSWNGTRWIASGTGGNTMAFSADGINWYGTNTSAVTNGLGIGTNYINGQIANGQILSSSMDFINDNCTNTTVNMVYNELG